VGRVDRRNCRQARRRHPRFGRADELGAGSGGFGVRSGEASREVWSAPWNTTSKGVGFEVRPDSTGLARALAAQRAIVDQAIGLGVFVAGCAVWWLAPIQTPQPFVGAVLFFGGIALAVEFAFGWATHEEAIMCADELILAGFRGDAQRTPIEQTVWHRLCAIEKPRSRRRLANALRWRLRLADGTIRPSPGYLRACAFPPLSRSQRRALLDERRRVLKMADRVEQAPVDPRALVILWGFVTTPPQLDPTGDRQVYDELRRRLQTASTLIKDDPGPATEPTERRTASRQRRPLSAEAASGLSPTRQRR
jgi:hypothetical protein